MNHRSGNFMYGNSGAAFRFQNGYAGQYGAPGTGRFQHENRSRMPGNVYMHSLQSPYSRTTPGFQNWYQCDVPYGQGGGGNFSQQRTGRGFGWADTSADQSMMFSVSRSRAACQPFKSGYSQGAKRGKSNRFTAESSSDINAGILEKLAACQSDGLHANDLARKLSCEKKDVNRALYAMQREGVVDKVSEKPPMWILKTKLNGSSAPRSRGFSCQADSFAEQRSSMPATSSHSDVSARSVVPLQVHRDHNEPVTSSMMESFDIIPPVTVSANIYTHACSDLGFDRPKTVVNAANSSLSSARSVHRASSALDSYDVIPAVAVVNNNDVSMLAQVRVQDVVNSNVPSSSAPCVSSGNATGIAGERTSTAPVDTLRTPFGELKKPFGRGRGLLLLNSVKDGLSKRASTSSMLDGSESSCGDTQSKAERRASDGQFDNVNEQPLSADDVVSPADNDRNSNPVSKMVITQQKSELTRPDEVLRGPAVGQSSHAFKPPLPPKQLIRRDPTYSAAMDCEVSLHPKDDTSPLLHGTHPESHFARKQERGFTVNVDRDSYMSLPDSLNALSFRSSSIPCSRSLDDLSKFDMLSHSSVDNPFAAALGVEDHSDDNAFSSGMSEGLSLTSESFAALNKNSVSALMEYAQSRHVTAEIKCIGSFGPPHRPVYVFTVIHIKLLAFCSSMCTTKRQRQRHGT